jgi:predicted dehydrogenase
MATNKKPDKQLRIGIVGLGGRGQGLLSILLAMDDVAITAVCDRYEDRTEAGVRLVTGKGRPQPFATRDYRELLRRDDVDCVITPSSWTSHSEIMVAAMKAGKPVASEVGGATSVEECWELFRTYKETGVPLHDARELLYGREEMALLNMLRQGLSANWSTARAAMSMNLRDEVSLGLDQRHYRFRNYQHRNGDIYPTHALGPARQDAEHHRGIRVRQPWPPSPSRHAVSGNGSDQPAGRTRGQ